MSVTINITVEDIDDKILTYAEIELYSSGTPGGPLTLVATIPLVADQTYYSYFHVLGTLNTWYQYRFDNPSPSGYSNPFRPDGLTRLKLRQNILDFYHAGITAIGAVGGTTTLVISDDYRVRTGGSTGRGRGGWIYPTATLETANITALNPVTGQFTVTPPLSAAVDALDEFEWHWTIPPEEMNRAINRGLLRYFYLDRVPVILTGEPEISLSDLPWIRNKRQITGLWRILSETSLEEPFQGDGRWWNIRQDQEGLWLKLSPSSASAVPLWLDAIHDMPELFTDDSVLPAQCNIDLASALAWDEVLGYLTLPFGGNTADRSVYIGMRKEHASGRLRRLIERYRPRPNYALPIAKTPIAVSQPWRSR